MSYYKTKTQEQQYQQEVQDLLDHMHDAQRRRSYNLTLTNEEGNALYGKGWFLANNDKIVVITVDKLKELGVELYTDGGSNG